MNGFIKLLKVILTLFAKNVNHSPVEKSKKKTEETKSQEIITNHNIKYKNDSKRLQEEFKELETKNYDLYDVIQDCALFCMRNFHKPITITMIYRTQDEQDVIYKDTPKYIEKKFTSPHQYWHGVDLRSSSYDTKQIKLIEEYLNSKYNKSNYYKWTAKDHTVGLGLHFHVQFVKK